MRSSMRPWIDNVGPAPIKAANVPCRDRCTPRTGYSRNLAVRMIDGTAGSASSGGYYGVGLGCSAIENENAAGEILPEHPIHLLKQPVPSSARR